MERDTQRRKRARDAVKRDAAAAAPRNVSGVPSLLFAHLIYLWSWGFLSLPFVQKVAMAASRDLSAAGGRPFSDLDFLAALGSEGKYPGNMQNEMQKRCLPDSKMTPAFRTQMPMQIRKGVVASREQAIILPHVMFSDLYHQYPKAWKTKVVPSVENLEGFWAAMEGHPLLETSGLRARDGGYKRNGVPLRIHGDDVPITGVGKTWCKMTSVWSWSFRDQSTSLWSSDL